MAHGATSHLQLKRQRLRGEARAKAGAGKSEEAAKLFAQAAEIAATLAERASTLRDRREWETRAAEDRDRAQRSEASAPRQSDGRLREAGSEGFIDTIEGLIQTPAQIGVRWDEIGGLADIKRDLQFSYGLALAKRPDDIKLPIGRNFLLYGPPGTGKTLLAGALCAQGEGTFYNVKVSSLLSKYFGDSPKLVSTLFEHARARAVEEGVVFIFIDEFHSLVAESGGDESGAERRLLSTILAEMDGLSEKGSDPLVFVVGATNHPSKLHAAALSRFHRRFYVPLPDPAARREILGVHLTRKGLKLSRDGADTVTLDDLVARTEQFSGRDLSRLCTSAVMNMLQEHNPGIPTAVAAGREATMELAIQVGVLTKAHFDAAFTVTRVDPDRLARDIAECETFARAN